MCFGRSKLVESVFEEVENAIEDADGEVERVLEIEKQRIVTTAHGLECSQCQEEGLLQAYSAHFCCYLSEQGTTIQKRSFISFFPKTFISLERYPCTNRVLQYAA